MGILASTLLLAVGLLAQAPGTTPVILQDFESSSPSPTVWVVNLPNENASVRLSTDDPREGKRCLGLHYRFVEGGGFQYLGVPVKVKVLAAAHKLRFALRGDGSGCSYGVQITDIRGETHQYSKNTGQGGVIDFQGWKDVVIDLDAGHETWGGDKNGKIDDPITAVTFTIGQPSDGTKHRAAEGDLAFDALAVDSSKGVAETLGRPIAVTSPAYGSEVKGDVKIAVAAPGFQEVIARSWLPGGKFGADSIVATIKLDSKGQGSFTLPADRYPRGPIAVRISGRIGDYRDTCYLQLYNRSGLSWNEGSPPGSPPAANGMPLAFADDFDGPLAISSTDPKATYYDHKPPNGYQDFSIHTFTGHDSSGNPFTKVDHYLRIRADDKPHSSGLISSMKNDASGLKVGLPCYFECRFLGPNAVGAWPGFWLMTDYMTEYKLKGDKTPCDELDIIEAYGGEGPGSPNADDTYMVTPHAWNQGDAGKALETKAFEGMRNPIRMRKFAIPSTWFEDIEVGRHATLPVCRERPLFFMINLATGGGWPVDLSRYDGRADMYVDYIRVYGKRL
jgi:hypothetical protein